MLFIYFLVTTQDPVGNKGPLSCRLYIVYSFTKKKFGAVVGDKF